MTTIKVRGRKKVRYTTYLSPEVLATLRMISGATGKPIYELIEEGADLVAKKYQGEVESALALLKKRLTE